MYGVRQSNRRTPALAPELLALCNARPFVISSIAKPDSISTASLFFSLLFAVISLLVCRSNHLSSQGNLPSSLPCHLPFLCSHAHFALSTQQMNPTPQNHLQHILFLDWILDMSQPVL